MKLAEGDVIEITSDHKVRAKVPKHFLYENYKGDFSLDYGAVNVLGEFAYLAGKYIVTRALMDGGGTGHGPHDVYPDGWHVFCKAIDSENEVDFYQSGCFNTLNEDIKVVGKAKLQWVFEETVDIG